MWQKADPKVSETAKVVWLLRKFIDDKMKGLDLGCGNWKVPGSIGVDIKKTPVVDHIWDVRDILVVQDYPHCLVGQQFDYIFSSHLLEDFEFGEALDISTVLVDGFLIPGGYYIVYVPHKGKYLGTNLDHKHEFVEGDMEELFEWLDLNIALIYYEAYHIPGMYGILGIGKKKGKFHD